MILKKILPFKDNYDYKIAIFILVHVLVWTLSPLLVRHSIGGDMAEHFFWGQEFELGYWKHPPLSAWIVGLWFKIFPTNDFFYFLLAQLNISIGFVFIYKVSFKLLKNKQKAYISTLIIELIAWYTIYPTFFQDGRNFNNDYVLLSAWPACIYYAIKVFKTSHFKDWIILSAVSSISLLFKYYSLVLFFCIGVFFLLNYQFLLKRKNFLYMLIAVTLFFVLISPHIFWIIQNDYITLKYIEEKSSKNFLLGSFVFFIVQMSFLLIPFALVRKTLQLSFKKLFYFEANKIYIYCFFLRTIFFNITHIPY